MGGEQKRAVSFYTRIVRRRTKPGLIHALAAEIALEREPDLILDANGRERRKAFDLLARAGIRLPGQPVPEWHTAPRAKGASE